MRAHSTDHEDAIPAKASTTRQTSEDATDTLRALAGGGPDAVGRAGMLNLQRAAGNSGVAQLLGEDQDSPVKEVVGSGRGQPLDTGVREDMEARFGADFSDVRVHTDDRATESAKAVGAHAYTTGSNVVFQRDQYAPDTDGGKRMLAHELTHVVQQRSGPVDGTPTEGGVSVSHPSDRFEQEATANADRIVSAPAPVPAQTAAAGAVQRQAEEEMPEEEPVQGMFVQREGEEEEIAEEQA
jgi:hypothetical protein